MEALSRARIGEKSESVDKSADVERAEAARSFDSVSYFSILFNKVVSRFMNESQKRSNKVSAYSCISANTLVKLQFEKYDV